MKSLRVLNEVMGHNVQDAFDKCMYRIDQAKTVQKYATSVRLVVMFKITDDLCCTYS